MRNNHRRTGRKDTSIANKDEPERRENLHVMSFGFEDEGSGAGPGGIGEVSVVHGLVN